MMHGWICDTLGRLKLNRKIKKSWEDIKHNQYKQKKKNPSE